MIRIGMVGTGQIAQTHARNLLSIGGVQIAGGIDVNPASAAAFAAQYGGDAYENIDQLLANSDAIYICTPPKYHRLPAVLAAEAGVHVFCEKPLCTTVEDALAIQRAVLASNIHFTIGFNLRDSPAFPFVKSTIDDGTVGKVYSFWGIRVLWLPHLSPNWRTEQETVCGMTIESLSHDFDILRWMLGDVSDVTGRVSTTRPDLVGYDNVMSATLGMKSGAMASLHSSWVSQVSYAKYGIVGEKGSVVFDWDKVRIKTLSDSNERLLNFKPSTDIEESHRPESERFIECLRTGKKPSIGISDGVGTVLISNAILQSSTQKRTIPLSELLG